MTYEPRYFDYSDFDQKGWPGSGERFMDPGFLAKLDELVETYCLHAGYKPKKGILEISSGYRSPEYNQRVSKTGVKGPHTTGKAVDILCHQQTMRWLIFSALALGFLGIGVSSSGAMSSRFVHLDMSRKTKEFWTY